MRHFWILSFLLVWVLSCANSFDDREPSVENQHDQSKSEQTDQLTTEKARNLIPKAASLSPEEFQAILDSPPFELEELENQSLTAVLLAIDPNEAYKLNFATHGKFHYVGSPILQPDPELLKAAVRGGPETNYVSVIQPEYITDCTCITRGDTANGKVAFRADSLYSGEALFAAKRIDEEWQIVAFTMPEFGLMTERQPDGNWQLVSENSLLGIEYP